MIKVLSADREVILTVGFFLLFSLPLWAQVPETVQGVPVGPCHGCPSSSNNSGSDNNQAYEQQQEYQRQQEQERQRQLALERERKRKERIAEEKRQKEEDYKNNKQQALKEMDDLDNEKNKSSNDDPSLDDLKDAPNDDTSEKKHRKTTHSKTGDQLKSLNKESQMMPLEGNEEAKSHDSRNGFDNSSSKNGGSLPVAEGDYAFDQPPKYKDDPNYMNIYAEGKKIEKKYQKLDQKLNEIDKKLAMGEGVKGTLQMEKMKIKEEWLQANSEAVSISKKLNSYIINP